MKYWAVNMPDRSLVSQLILKCGVSSLTAAVLASKGYSSPESVFDNLNVEELSDPFLIKDMDIAAETINEAIDNGTKICVYGDYDCDGIMATVMLYSYLIETGADVFYYIPERSEGYGMNSNAIKQIADEGTELIITVDNGISALLEAELIYNLNMKLVVTDHHQPGNVLPKAEAIVDPHRQDCYSPFKLLCGAGVVLKLIAALDGGDYTMALEQFGDLAALATVADIVSLTSENRFIVSYGMRLIEDTDRIAIEALKKVSGLSGKNIDSFSIGFGLAPRINASGRFGSPKTAVELFLSENDEDAEKIAQELNLLNEKRKNTEKEILNEIYQMIDSNMMLVRDRVIFICGKNWHHGVIGIVASRISEQFGKPCFIASECDGEIRGSARSFGDFSVYEALSFCSDVLEKFGGHPGAGGFTVKLDRTNEFNKLLNTYALNNHKNMPLLTITADAPITPTELTIQNISGLKVLEPFGAGNEKPLFFIENASVVDIISLSGGIHSKLKIKLGYTIIDALIFRCSSKQLSIAKGDTCNFIVSLDINSYMGKNSISAIVKDYRTSSIKQSKIFSALSAFEAFLRNELLPQNYYKSMYPIRNEVKEIYIKIPSEGINTDTLYTRISKCNINYCKFCVAIEALRQLNLISFSSSDNTIFRLNTDKKTDLLSAPVLSALKLKIN